MHRNLTRPRPVRLGAVAGAAALAMSVVFATVPLSGPAGAAATIFVSTSTTGTDGCSLEEAIWSANLDDNIRPDPANTGSFLDTGCLAGDGVDTIQLQLGVTYSLSQIAHDDGNYTGPTATPLVTSTILVDGNGARIERATSADVRAFAVGETGALTIRDLHVKGFSARGGDGRTGGGGGLGAGGAVFVHGGQLTIERSTFELNGATGGNGSHNSHGFAGGGGGGLGGDGGTAFGTAFAGGGGGGGARGNGGTGDVWDFGGGVGGGGGGTIRNGEGGDDDGEPGSSGGGGFRCGGAGGIGDISLGGEDGDDGTCRGGGGGGGESLAQMVGVLGGGDGGTGAFGGGGGGGGYDATGGGDGGFGGGGGGGTNIGAGLSGFSPDGGEGGFGGGGGASGHAFLVGGPGFGGSFAGNADEEDGGGGAGLGGAVFGYAADITIINSTFTRNYAVRGVEGGPGAQNGADAGGVIFTVAGVLRVLSSTVAGNESTGDGAGIVTYKPTTGEETSIALRNTIVAGNAGRDQCFVLGGVTQFGAGNLVVPTLDDRRTDCPGIEQTGDPQLGPLTREALGQTPTMAIPLISPAVDTGDPVAQPATDQRGVTCPQNAGFDIGAYEAGPPDTFAPLASPTRLPEPNGFGWSKVDVTVSWNWADVGTAGIDPAACTVSSVASGEGSANPVSATCADLAGNVGSASTTVAIDRTAPKVVCGTTPTYVIGGAHSTNVRATVTDQLSGPVTTSVSADVTAADVATPGVKAKFLTGSDRAGNTTTARCSYVVSYAFLGFTEPFPQTSHRAGSTIPVKFRLGNASGRPITDAAAAALLQPTCLVRVTLDGTAQGCARYDATSNQFQFDVKTPRSLSAGAHQIGVRVQARDGSGLVNSDTVTVVIRN